MSQKRKKTTKKVSSNQSHKETASNTSKSFNLSFLDAITPKAFEDFALIVLNFFFATHAIGGFLLHLFYPTEFKQFFQENKSPEGFMGTAILVLIVVLGILFSIFYWKRNQVNLLRFSQLSLVSVVLLPFIFLEDKPFAQNYLFFTLTVSAVGYVLYRVLEKVDYSFLDRWEWVRSKTFQWTSLLLIIVYSFICLAIVALNKHWSFTTQTFDLGVYANQIYHLVHDGSSFTSVWGANGMYHFYIHLSPIYYLVAVPFLALFESIETLLIVQTAFMVLAMVPLFLIAKQQGINPILGIILVFAFILAPGTHGPLNYDFHEIAFFPFFSLWLFYFIEKENRIGISIAFLLTLFVKEDIALMTICLSIFLLIYKKKLYREAIGILLISIFYYVVVVNILFKTDQTQFHFFAKNFKFLAGAEDGGISEMLVSFIINPLGILNYSFINDERLYILISMFLPVIFLPFLSRGRMILLGSAMIIYGFLDIGASNIRIGGQYTAYLTPIIYYLAVIKLSSYSRNRQAALILLMFFFSIFFCKSFRYFEFDLSKNYQTVMNKDNPRRQFHKNCIDRLPSDNKYSLAASNFYVPQLSLRDSVFMLGTNKKPDLWIFASGATHRHRHQEEVEATQKIINSGEYNFVYKSEDNSCIILKRNDIIIQ